MNEFVFDRHNVEFYKPTEDIKGYVIISIDQHNKTNDIKINVYEVINNARRSLELKNELKLSFNDQIKSINLTSSGHLHILANNNKLVNYQITNKHRSFELLSIINFNKNLIQNTVEILGLNGSLVLLVGKLLNDLNKFVLLIWDTNLDVLLFDKVCDLPSSLTNKQDIEFNLNKLANSSACLNILSKSTNKKAESSSFIINYNTMNKSTLIESLNKDLISLNYRSGDDNDNEKVKKDENISNLDIDNNKLKKLLHDVDNLLKKSKCDESLNKFNSFIIDENQRLKSISENLNKEIEEDLTDEDEDGRKINIKKPKKDIKVKVPEWFMKSLIRIIFNHSFEVKSKDKRTFKKEGYANKLISQLLTLKLINNEYLLSIDEEGLLEILWECEDYSNFIESIYTVNDIPESSLVKALKNVVDSKENKISLKELLKSIMFVDYTSNIFSIKLIKEIKNVEDIVLILNVLLNYLQDYYQHFQSSFDKPKSRSNNNVDKRQPSIEKIIKFFNLILDNYFTSIIFYKPSHEVLISIKELLNQILYQHSLLVDLGKYLQGFKSQFDDEQFKLSQQSKINPKLVKHEKKSLGVGKYSIEQFSLN